MAGLGGYQNGDSKRDRTANALRGIKRPIQLGVSVEACGDERILPNCPKDWVLTFVVWAVI
jgi:hypothetical protein